MVKNMNDLVVEYRLQNLLNSWSKQMVLEFKNYYSCASWNEGLSFSSKYCNKQVPFWFKLPTEMFHEYLTISKDSKKGVLNLLNDSLWAQYCLFMHSRIKDDVIDLDTDKRNLILISDLFRIEAEENLKKYFKYSNLFWSTYYQLLKETTIAMLAKESIEKLKNPAPSKIIEYHGQESSVLLVGLAAICYKFRKRKDFLLLKNYCSLIISSRQIIDDLLDLDEDIKRGNNNYITAKFIQKGIIELIIDEELYTSVMNTRLKFSEITMVLNDAHMYLDKAKLSITSLKTPLLNEIILDFRIYINSIKAKLNQKIMEIFHNSDLSPLIHEQTLI